MQACSYCDEMCQPAREHVIPEWYNHTPGDAETFSARAPVTHLKGDLLVKDVCRCCNNVVLSELDGYGKQLYTEYFATPVYWDDAVTFEYDGGRLIRWLLKLSYNSARAQNADQMVLREYRKVMLGEASIPDRIRCWVHLVGASRIDSSAKVVRPARRDECDLPGVYEPHWFRICQLRLGEFPAISLVQRAVVINSFAFTLLIARPDSPWPDSEFDRWTSQFIGAYPAANAVTAGLGRVNLIAAGDHAGASIYPLLYHYPTRFRGEENPAFVQFLKNQRGLVMLSADRELIEKSNAEPLTWALRDMISTREKALAFRQRLGVMVVGYDADPRELWHVPEARNFFRNLFIECPFVMLLAHPDGGLLKLLAACWIYEEQMTDEMQQQRTHNFLARAFHGLNALNHTLAFSEELNREICDSAMRSLFGDANQSV